MSVLAGSWPQGPPLCSVQKPLDPELGEPSVPEQIPLGIWAGFCLPPTILSPPHGGRHHFFPEVGHACGWSASSWSLCFLPQNQVRNSGPAYPCHLSLVDAVNHQPFAGGRDWPLLWAQERPRAEHEERAAALWRARSRVRQVTAGVQGSGLTGCTSWGSICTAWR